MSNARPTGYFPRNVDNVFPRFSLHHIIQQAGAVAGLTFPIHTYMLRRSNLYYRCALLLKPTQLSLRQCCLLWNWHETTVGFSPQEQQEFGAISQAQADAFMAALVKLRAFTGIQGYENLIDYLLGAFLLFPRLMGIPEDYWLSPAGWQQ